MMKLTPGAFCMDHGSAPLLPRRFPLILEPRARPWRWSDGFPGIWIQKLIPLMPFPTMCKAIVETLRPVTPDASTGDFDTDPSTGLNLWTVLDDNSESDNVRFFDALAGTAAQNECPATTAVAPFEVNIANPVGTPAHFDCQGLRWRFRHKKLESGSWFPGTVNVGQVQLRETTTQRDTTAPGAIGTSYGMTTVTLTDSEYNNISTHDNLRIRYSNIDTCADTALNGGPTLMVAWVELEYFAK